MTNIRKTLQMNIIMSQKILLWHCSAILTLIGLTGQIQYSFRFLTNENIIFVPKIVR